MGGRFPGRGIGDVAKAGGAGPAGGADVLAAIGGRLPGAGPFPFAEEELPIDPRIDEIPGEGFGEDPLPAIFRGIHSRFPEGPVPPVRNNFV